MLFSIGISPEGGNFRWLKRILSRPVKPMGGDLTQPGNVASLALSRSAELGELSFTRLSQPFVIIRIRSCLH